MQTGDNTDIKAVFIYASAVHGARVIDSKEISETLRTAKENGFGKVIIIKKTQIAAKTKSLSKDFVVCPYPKSSINKAIANANACIVVNGMIATKRKNTKIDKIIEEANKKMKFMFCLSMEP